MPRALTFRRGYALAAAALFAIEVGIALFVRDSLVRPYLGDTLAVMLVYAGLRAVTRLPVRAAAALALAVAVAVELGQFLGLLDRVGLRGNRLAETVLGTGFEVMDLVAYAAGALAILLIERSVRGKWG